MLTKCTDIAGETEAAECIKTVNTRGSVATGVRVTIIKICNKIIKGNKSTFKNSQRVLFSVRLLDKIQDSQLNFNFRFKRKKNSYEYVPCYI